MAKNDNDNGKTSEERVVEAVEESADNLIHLSTGVVLKGKTAPPLALVRVIAAFPRPKPPLYKNETLGRWIENPADPDYLEQVQAHKTEEASAMLNALILLGTELVSVPKGFPKPSDNGWIDEYKELGFEPKTNPAWRYLNWVIFKAAVSNEDMARIQEVVGRLSGVPESAVQSAEDFPGSP